VLPKNTSREFLSSASGMFPFDLPNKFPDQWVLGNNRNEFIVYTLAETISLDLTKTTNMFSVRWINPEDGKLFNKEEKVNGGKRIQFKAPQSGAAILWLTRLQ
jgi:hypothetical protein